MSKGIVLSLYDFTGEALKPWAEAGYTCYAFDIQHKGWTIESYGDRKDEHVGSINYIRMDLWTSTTSKQYAVGSRMIT